MSFNDEQTGQFTSKRGSNPVNVESEVIDKNTVVVRPTGNDGTASIYINGEPYMSGLGPEALSEILKKLKAPAVKNTLSKK